MPSIRAFIFGRRPRERSSIPNGLYSLPYSRTARRITSHNSTNYEWQWAPLVKLGEQLPLHLAPSIMDRGSYALEHHPKLVCYRLSLCSDAFNRVYKPLDF
ncbi:hypothetical protein VN97_g3977 [Penicillium thymicola]|uniref:Uncharacterized protein n=1 Tax=Penicillium thymicola TaxID=293382 RepID=A0AAI9TLB6_PENTH|nr:hypothetical protein VN97_g3977 [Penicillium thymicola]